ncbi:MAG TPA: hypothetical protein PK006_06515 [Saprospiraceae bacterium]|nr:hypothetical protein [Saprospiraceae bacterium]
MRYSFLQFAKGALMIMLFVFINIVPHYAYNNLNGKWLHKLSNTFFSIKESDEGILVRLEPSERWYFYAQYKTDLYQNENGDEIRDLGGNEIHFRKYRQDKIIYLEKVDDFRPTSFPAIESLEGMWINSQNQQLYKVNLSDNIIILQNIRKSNQRKRTDFFHEIYCGNEKRIWQNKLGDQLAWRLYSNEFVMLPRSGRQALILDKCHDGTRKRY